MLQIKQLELFNILANNGCTSNCGAILTAFFVSHLLACQTLTDSEPGCCQVVTPSSDDWACRLMSTPA